MRPIVLLVREPGVIERLVSFEKPELQIGREQSDDLRLIHASIPTGLRARLRRDQSDLVLINYSSAAPVRVNGQSVSMCGVAHGDVLAIGEVELIVVSDMRADPREQALLDDIANEPADETMRAVYADWLEENGFASRAEYLRLDSVITTALKGPFRASIREDTALLSGLARNLPPAWLALVRRRPNR
jgi:uncharacterized protein (TIGR02996 family)